jgi:hypothetical protein
VTTDVADSTGTGDQDAEALDSTAVRTALWRALHVEVDALPHVLEDRVPGGELAERCFTGRADGLRPSSGGDFVVATT